ncbi:Polyprenol-phosphate-mannose-dependent alpha-(1-2)-phosphatidylinositol mannoside mannosyltransferase [Corynebacterium comes]|uniref:Polyprenol-phosphate-mannose-dependent alpha-(1-2)-phosphatidylinositol mannoside mannosyltransferase n=2 Tax=Corynebacterium comes TaxID=2675218 RepID=A0A6B8W3L1_9CORY|nr:Polyprenol-phosphate-mannose-dependent alpha-(1-2)-phosphatidylinositol mannoside mannosyltransferase [Corynebacterium comes]
MVTALGLIAGFGVTGRQLMITDFPVDMIIYRSGVRAFLEGREMYSVPMYAGDLALPFIYPPFGALILVPLSVFDRIHSDLAGDIMVLVSSALILVCLWFVLQAVTRGSVDKLGLAALTAATWPVALLIEPVWLNAGFAQINVVIMALVVLDLVPRKRFLPQGSLIGIAAAIKITPLAMLLFFLLRKDFRAIIVAGVSGLVATGIAALLRWDATVDYFSTVLLGMGTDSEFGVSTVYQSNSSLKGMLMRWWTSDAALDANSTLTNLIWLVLALLTIGFGGWLMIALFRRDMLVDAALVNALIMLLISPVSWSHHWIWLTLLLPVLAWRCLTVLRAPVVLGALVFLWAALVLTQPPKWWYGDAIDIHYLTGVEKFLVSDFVWLGIAVPVAWAFALRRVKRAG